MNPLPRVLLVLVALSLNCIPCLAQPVNTSQYKDTIRVACVGDSITAGYGATKGNAYPQQLGRMLGDKWNVQGYGVSGATLLNAGDRPYQKEYIFTLAVKHKADVIIVMLGTNDTKANNWARIDAFEADYKDLITKLTAPNTKPRIFLARPCVVLGKGAFGITEEVLLKEFPKIDAVAKEVGAEVVDVHAVMAAATKDNPALIPDNVHPDSDGTTLLAGAFFKAITGKNYDGPTPVLPPPTPKPAATQPAANK